MAKSKNRQGEARGEELMLTHYRERETAPHGCWVPILFIARARGEDKYYLGTNLEQTFLKPIAQMKFRKWLRSIVFTL